MIFGVQWSSVLSDQWIYIPDFYKNFSFEQKKGMSQIDNFGAFTVYFDTIGNFHSFQYQKKRLKLKFFNIRVINLKSVVMPQSGTLATSKTFVVRINYSMSTSGETSILVESSIDSADLVNPVLRTVTAVESF